MDRLSLFERTSSVLGRISVDEDGDLKLVWGEVRRLHDTRRDEEAMYLVARTIWARQKGSQMARATLKEECPYPRPEGALNTLDDYLYIAWTQGYAESSLQDRCTRTEQQLEAAFVELGKCRDGGRDLESMLGNVHTGLIPIENFVRAFASHVHALTTIYRSMLTPDIAARRDNKNRRAHGVFSRGVEMPRGWRPPSERKDL